MADCITPPATGPPTCQHLPSNLMISPNRSHVNASVSIGMQGPFGSSYGQAMGGGNGRFPNAASNLPASVAGLTHGSVGDTANPHKSGGSQPVYVFPTSTANR